MAQQLSTLIQNNVVIDIGVIIGTVPIIRGGTGATTAAGALTSLGAYASNNPNGYTNNTGTVTSMAALTLGTTGTDVTSTVATGSTTPIVTLNIPTASAANRGVLSTADWSTFNGKQATLTFTPENAANKGAASGYAPLDATSKISSTYLPSYVDDVLEYANLAALPVTGTAGLIYVTVDTNKTYRWSGSAYVEISASPGSTDAVTEGSTNKYYTDTRARASISATQNITYNSSTGVITGPVLSGYAPLASPTFTGTVTAPTFTGSLNGGAAYSNALRQSDGTSFLNPTSGISTSGSRSTYLAPNTYVYGLFSEFKNINGVSGFSGNYAGLLTYAPWQGTSVSTGDPSYQLAFSPSAASTTSNPSLKIRAGIDTTWGDWNTILHSGNYTSYSPTLTGTGASGSWPINITGTAGAATAASFLNGGASSIDAADITTRINSGFFQGSNPTTANGWPVTGTWYHLHTTTHSNTTNYYAMQLAADFFTQSLYYRSTNGSGSTVWNKVIHEGLNGTINIGSGQFYKDASGVISINRGATIGTYGGQAPILELYQTSIGSTDADGATQAIFGSSAFGTDKGSATAYGFKYNTAGNYATSARVRGAKENATDGNLSGYLAFDTRANGGNLTEKMRITASGDVAIGISAIAPASKLHIRQDQDGTTRQIIQNRNATGTPLTELTFLTGGLDFSDNRYAYIQSGGTSSNYISFGTCNGTTPTEKMRISATGLVTITNGAVIQGLTVGLGANAVANNIAVGVSALPNGSLSGGYNIAVGSYALFVNTTGLNNTAIGAGSTQANIAGNNNVGIGLNSLYSNTGSNNIAIGTYAGPSLTTGNNNTIIGSVPGTAGLSDTVIIAAGSAERMRIDSSGNVGIGLSTPAARLDVYLNQNAATRIRVNNQNSGVSAITGIEVLAYGGGWTIDVPPSTTYVNPLIFSASGTSEKMRIEYSGNVGIGTTSPGSKLTVVGQIESTATGFKFPDGTIQASAATGAPTLVIVTATTQTAASGKHYVLTNAAASTLTLPASPVAGNLIYVTSGNGLATNVIAYNGNKIMGLSENLTINTTAYTTMQLRYLNATIGWALI